VAHRGDGSVGVWRVQGQQFTEAGRIALGNAASQVSHATFTRDGRFALVTRQGDSSIAVLAVNGDQVTATDRQITAGVLPYGLAVTPDGRWAVVANLGRGNGDADTVSLIDLQRQPFRVVDTLSVGQTPEGIMTSPDNRHVAVTVVNGSNLPSASPFHGPGLVRMLRIEGGRLAAVSEARTGSWSQGVAFSADGRTLLVGNMVERNVQVYRVAEDGALSDTGQAIAVTGGSAALRTAGQ
jgi:DNA-binding beta-propeller fold protein YncE